MKVLVFMFLITLQGCSWLDFFKPSPGLEVDTEIVVGDKQEEIATGAVIGKRETITNTAETIHYHKVDEGMSIWEMFLLMLMSFLLGWLAMPSARQMWLMIKKRFT